MDLTLPTYQNVTNCILNSVKILREGGEVISLEST